MKRPKIATWPNERTKNIRQVVFRKYEGVAKLSKRHPLSAQQTGKLGKDDKI